MNVAIRVAIPTYSAVLLTLHTTNFARANENTLDRIWVAVLCWQNSNEKNQMNFDA